VKVSNVVTEQEVIEQGGLKTNIEGGTSLR
jgi:hypothetical protein